MQNDEMLQSILDSYDDSDYPEGFQKEYVPLECLSDRNGVCTFVVQDKNEDRFIAKCYDRSVWTITGSSRILKDLDHPGLPKAGETFENEKMKVTVREYIEGESLERYAAENELSEQEIVRICVSLCDILAYLHHRQDPVIHRDIKPQNIIVKEDGSIVLIDFDIARVYHKGNDTDTVFFGTLAYAPPEQYGFSQTDARTDIYSLGILLRRLLTGSTKENKNVKVYRPLDKIIRKCTGFSPKERFSDVDQVKKALLKANPRSQALRTAAIAVCTVLAAGALTFGGMAIYRYVTYTPFGADAIPAFLSDEERVSDAVDHMKKTYGTDIFDSPDNIAYIGDLRAVLIECYGLDREYVYGFNEEMPQESEDFFLPWGWDDGQTVDKEPCVYAAVKAHDPALVADWSSLKEDNGFYPGVRVAVGFAEETGIMTGVNRPGDLSLGEMAVIFANADRVFDSAQTD